MLGITTQTCRPSLKPVYAMLRLPPTTTVGLPARLRPLPASQLALGLIVCLRVLPELTLGVGCQRGYAGIDSTRGNASVRLRTRSRLTPVFQGERPAARCGS